MDCAIYGLPLHALGYSKTLCYAVGDLYPTLCFAFLLRIKLRRTRTWGTPAKNMKKLFNPLALRARRSFMRRRECFCFGKNVSKGASYKEIKTIFRYILRYIFIKDKNTQDERAEDTERTKNLPTHSSCVPEEVLTKSGACRRIRTPFKGIHNETTHT